MVLLARVLYPGSEQGFFSSDLTYPYYHRAGMIIDAILWSHDMGVFEHAPFNPYTPTSHTWQFSLKSLPKELGNV